MNDHERIHELLALRLYDEVTAGEAELVDAHLADCPQCAGFAAELAASLGELARAAASPPAAVRRLRPAAALALLGFAAGVLLTWLLTAPRAAAPDASALARSTHAAPALDLDLDLDRAPPLAAGPGRLGRLSGYLR